MKHLYWLGHLLWLLGNLYINFLKFNFDEVFDTWQWVQIHLSYKAELVEFSSPEWKHRLKNIAIQIFGLLMSLCIIYAISRLSLLFTH